MSKQTHSKPKQKSSRPSARAAAGKPDLTPETVARGVAAAVVEQVAAAFEPADR